MRLLVTGRSGQVARALASAGRGEVVAVGRPDLDISDPAGIARALARHRPDLVVNTAAYTAVDAAESDAANAFAVNRDGAGHVAAVARAAGLPLIHLSTDHVFSGTGSPPYREEDATGPCNIYGRSKLAGEAAARSAHPGAIILRTAWVFDALGPNFVTAMLRLGRERDALRVVGDQWGTPTYAPDLADAILVAARALLTDPKPGAGLFHVVAEGWTSRAGFAEAIFAEGAMRGGRRPAVEIVASADYPTSAARPLDARLDPAKFIARFGHALPHWREGLARCFDAMARKQD